MRIGICTFTAANNLGAVLQAYALKQKLRLEGHEAFCIDYRPSYLWDKYQPFSKIRIGKGNVLKNIVREFRALPYLRKKNSGYNAFRADLMDMLPEEDIKSLDMVVVGSDQVWNFSLTGHDRMFLGYIPGFKGKVVTYAASMEKLISDTQALKDALPNFSCISVREKSLQTFMKNEFDADTTLVLDPTLLLSHDEWTKIEEPYPTEGKPFMLAYVFGIDEKRLAQLRKLANDKGMQLLVFRGSARAGKGLVDTASPRQFLYLLRNAECVVTNSFHGTAFSINYGKRFCVIPKETNERIETLLDFADIPQALLPKGKDVDYSDFVQCNSFTDKLTDMLRQSENYLQQITKD